MEITTVSFWEICPEILNVTVASKSRAAPSRRFEQVDIPSFTSAAFRTNYLSVFKHTQQEFKGSPKGKTRYDGWTDSIDFGIDYDGVDAKKC